MDYERTKKIGKSSKDFSFSFMTLIKNINMVVPREQNYGWPLCGLSL